jgi:hypothetical protein
MTEQEKKYEKLSDAVTDAKGKLTYALADGTAKRPPDTQAYFEAAKARQNDGTLEIDDNAIVSLGADNGAYVEAWIWVEASDAGVVVEEDE